MKHLTILTAVVGLAACAGTPEQVAPQPPRYEFREARLAAAPPPSVPESPPADATPLNPARPGRPKTYRSAVEKIAEANRASRMTALNCFFVGSAMTCPFEYGRPIDVILDSPTTMQPQDELNAWKERDSYTTTIVLAGDEMADSWGTSIGEPYITMQPAKSALDGGSWAARRELSRQMGTSQYHQVFVVKSYVPNLSATGEIRTNKRLVQFSFTTNSRHGAAYNRTVQFTEPKLDQAGPDLRAEAAQAQRADVDRAYVVSGTDDLIWREWEVWNDGAATHVKPPRQLATRLTPQVKGVAELDYDVKPDGSYVVRGLPQAILFQRGQSRLLIERKAP